MKKRLFVSVTGDYPNVGDAFIRRVAFDWVRSAGDALVYARDAPDVWVRHVGSSPSDSVLISGRASWLRAILRCRRAVVAFEPGEILLDLKSLPRELAFLATIVVTRLRGGTVLLPPRAIAGNPHPATVAVHRLSCRFATAAMWREKRSISIVGAGELSPDIGFAGELMPGLPASARDTLVVSLRGHRPYPTDVWIESVRSWAAQHQLKIVTLAQVHDDQTRARDLAEALNGTCLDWASDDIAQEHAVRNVYVHSKLVLSDRLHVLILASLSGAVPAEVVASPVPKVEQHFAQIGFSDVSRDASKLSGEGIGAFLQDQSSRQAELASRLADARQELGVTQAKIAASIARTNADYRPS